MKGVPIRRLVPLAIACLFCACNRNADVEEIVARPEDRMLVKHWCQELRHDGWKIEVWHYGTLLSTWDPVHVGIRLTDLRGDPRNTPKTELCIQLWNPATKMAVRKATLTANLQECAKMDKRKEITYKDRVHGDRTTFPPAEPCWEAKIVYVFGSDPRDASALPAGNYELMIDVALDGHAIQGLSPVPVRLFDTHRPSNDR